MPLTAGTRLGPYIVEAPIGAGGMGEVYRARDSKLNRDIALKVLPELFTADPDRLTRFRREAQVLASLNHPNIAHIYGLEDAHPSTGSGQALSTTSGQAVHALVLELVEGSTLAERIAQGPIPLEEALPIARQIADALEYAHEQGIVHRDLKPANIKVRADDTVKVLDFGLAKAIAPEGAATAGAMNSPTLTARGTQLGMIVGTAAYMAPEQARGRVVDRRADIWAFGVVLYEMLSGEGAFEGDDVSITLASVLKEEPKWNELPGDLPASVRRLLRRCLEKDPKRRLSAIADARLELDDVGQRDAPSMLVPAAASSRGWVPWTVAAITTAATLMTLALWAPWREPPASGPTWIPADIAVDGPLALSIGPAAVISPDGRMAVFVMNSAGRNKLYVRRLGGLQSIALQGTDDGFAPFFSPDSQWIAFFTPGKLKKIPSSGGTPIALCDTPNGRGGSWGPDGTIVFQPNTSVGALLHAVSADGGSPLPIGTERANTVRRWPDILPNGKGVIYSSNATSISWDLGSVMVQPLPSGEPKVLVQGAFHGRYVNTGHLLYMKEGTLFSVPFDAERLETHGGPAPVVEEVFSAVNTGGAQFSMSQSGTLLYVPGKTQGNAVPVTWLDRQGRSSVLRAEPADWSFPSFSPNGKLLAMTIGFGYAADVWIYDPTRDSATQLTFGRGPDTSPTWSPDGRTIVYASAPDETSQVTNLYWKRSDGSGDAQRLTQSPNSQIPFSFHPAGKYLAYAEQTPDTGFDIIILPLEWDEKTGWKPGTPRPFVATRAVEHAPAFSPDGHWIAYSSTEQPLGGIFVRRFPAGDGERKVSTGVGGLNPRWSPKRPELFYAGPTSGQIAVMAVDYQSDGASFRAERPRQWFPSLVPATRPSRPFDIHPDGDRIAIAKPVESAEPQQRPVFVFNFFDVLRGKK
jgi:Tol biopolymer transport system component